MEDRTVPDEAGVNKKTESSAEEMSKTLAYFRETFAMEMKRKASFYLANIVLAAALIITVLGEGFFLFKDAEIYAARLNGRADSLVQISIKNKIDSSKARFNQ